MADRTTICPGCRHNYNQPNMGKFQPAQIVRQNIASTIEYKLKDGCWDFVIGPLMNYMSRDVYLAPQIIGYLLNTIEAINNSTYVHHIQKILELHLALHPPCREGMYEYYGSILEGNITSYILDNTILKHNFCDLIQKIIGVSKTLSQRAISTQNIPNPFLNAASPKNRQEGMKLLEESLTMNFFTGSPFSSQQNDSENSQSKFELLIFVFNFYVNILQHDFMVHNEGELGVAQEQPLIVNLIWKNINVGEITPHVKDIFRVYSSVPAEFRGSVAKYIVLLAEVARTHASDLDNEFPFYRNKKWDSKFVKTLALSCTEKKQVTFKSIELIQTIPSNWLRFQLSKHLLGYQLITNANHKEDWGV